MDSFAAHKMIEDKVRNILAERLGLYGGDISGTMLLGEDLDIDSFDALRIIFEVEDEFDIKVPPDEVSGIRSVGDIVEYISKRLTKEIP